AQIYFWASPMVAPLLYQINDLTGVLSAPKILHRHFINYIKSLDLDIAYVLFPTFHNALTLVRARVPRRVGSLRRWYSPLFTQSRNISRRYSSRHEVELNLQLISPDWFGILPQPTFPRINLPPESIAKIIHILSASGYDHSARLIVIHPGSGGSARNWPPEYFRATANALSDRLSCQIAVTGTASESSLGELVSDNRHLNLCGKLNLLELAALLTKADLTIANSTGPLHLAVALSRPTLGLYPPVRGCLPDRWGPYGHPEWSLKPDLPLCRRCHSGTLSACACMEALKPDTVAERAVEILDVN
ncbi:MAG: glycosyltransferase family 9 protein, partial [Calditrichota bacterium]